LQKVVAQMKTSRDIRTLSGHWYVPRNMREFADARKVHFVKNELGFRQTEFAWRKNRLNLSAITQCTRYICKFCTHWC